jgi:oligopeptidase B
VGGTRGRIHETSCSVVISARRAAEPQAEQHPLERTLHDLRLIDEYAWLKAENWREVTRNLFLLDPSIRAYLQAENDYCERARAHTKGLQETLFAEMKGRIKEDDPSVPDPDGPYAYYIRYRKEGQHPLLCRAPRNPPHFFPSTQAADVKPEEQLLLDGDALAHGKAFFRLGARGIHPHIVCSRGSPTKPAPSSTPRVCALSTPGPISPTSCQMHPAQWFGRRTTRPSTMCGSPHLLDPTDALDDEYLSAHCL